VGVVSVLGALFIVFLGMLITGAAARKQDLVVTGAVGASATAPFLLVAVLVLVLCFDRR
jgi:hypothetical protein